jgi:dienelactone hydrolase
VNDDVELFEERLELVREDGVTLPGTRLTPSFESAEGMNGAGVVVVAGEWGLEPADYERFAKPLARLGFFVVATDLVRGMRAESAAAAQQRAAGLDHAIAIDDIEAALLCVKELARGRLGVIGLDVAAQVAIEAATVLPHIDAVVHIGGPPPRETARLQRLRAAILVHKAAHGEMNDAAYMAMYERMRRSKADLLGHDYDASESFFVRPQGEDEEMQARIAFDRTRDFLVATLT